MRIRNILAATSPTASGTNNQLGQSDPLWDEFLHTLGAARAQFDSMDMGSRRVREASQGPLAVRLQIPHHNKFRGHRKSLEPILDSLTSDDVAVISRLSQISREKKIADETSTYHKLTPTDLVTLELDSSIGDGSLLYALAKKAEEGSTKAFADLCRIAEIAGSDDALHFATSIAARDSTKEPATQNLKVFGAMN